MISTRLCRWGSGPEGQVCARTEPPFDAHAPGGGPIPVCSDHREHALRSGWQVTLRGQRPGEESRFRVTVHYLDGRVHTYEAPQWGHSPTELTFTYYDGRPEVHVPIATVARWYEGAPSEPASELSDRCDSFGCTLPAGHNRGRADVPENHASSGLQLRKPGGVWYPFRHFVKRFHVPGNVEWRFQFPEGEDPRTFPVVELDPMCNQIRFEPDRRLRLVVLREGREPDGVDETATRPRDGGHYHEGHYHEHLDGLQRHDHDDFPPKLQVERDPEERWDDDPEGRP